MLSRLNIFMTYTNKQNSDFYFPLFVMIAWCQKLLKCFSKTCHLPLAAICCQLHQLLSWEKICYWIFYWFNCNKVAYFSQAIKLIRTVCYKNSHTILEIPSVFFLLTGNSLETTVCQARCGRSSWEKANCCCFSCNLPTIAEQYNFYYLHVVPNKSGCYDF